MRISVDFLPRGVNASPEEANTVSRLRIRVGSSNATDMRIGEEARITDYITAPVYPLAEAIAFRWWQILYGRGNQISLRALRAGFVFPDITILGFGNGQLEIKCQPFRFENPPVQFVMGDKEFADVSTLTLEFERFIEQTLSQLSRRGIQSSLLANRFELIQSSLEDNRETAFCRASGALGVDPYTCSDEIAGFIEAANRFFDGDSLEEFLSGVAPKNGERTIEWLQHAEAMLGDLAHLPAVEDFRRELNFHAHSHAAYEEGYRSAEKMREQLGILPGESFEDVKKLASRLGNPKYRLADSSPGKLRGVSHVPIGRARVIVGSSRYPEAELFSVCRTIGDAIHFGAPRHSPVNDQITYRQRLGRAFAAEFLAPARAVLAMSDEGESVDTIAKHFGVSDEVISHQIENSPNWLS